MSTALVTAMYCAGAAMLMASLALGGSRLDYNANLERNRCNQERRMASDGYALSDRCRKLWRDSDLGVVLLIGGFSMLALTRVVKSKVDR